MENIFFEIYYQSSKSFLHESSILAATIIDRTKVVRIASNDKTEPKRLKTWVSPCLEM